MMPLSLGDAKGSGQKGYVPMTPWSRMLRHPAVWAIVVNNFTFHYAFYVVMNWLPTYFDRVPQSPRIKFASEMADSLHREVLVGCS